jgi:alpha,alpha-trehalase
LYFVPYKKSNGMKLVKLIGLLAILVAFQSCRQATTTPSAAPETSMLPPSERYQSLFVDVQMARIFPDGKTFADCIPKYDNDYILDNYDEAKGLENFDLKAFVLDHFELPPEPATGFQSDTSRSAAEHINVLWDVLTRTPEQADPGTLIALPNAYIVPGGRFREVYYWDSYFTMLGLQASGRVDMIEHMTDNFAFLIDSIGFIPNGNRTYFLTRSQPPFFAAMVNLLAEEKGEQTLVHYLPQLEKEYNYWMAGKAEVNVENRTNMKVVYMDDNSLLNRYYDQGTTPRDEMYADDVETAEENERPEAVIYQHLRSACESGWDFSCRWFEEPEELSSIHTMDIIPVDLNALLYHLEKTIARAYTIQGEEAKGDDYEELAQARMKAVMEYCWDEESGFFRDYDFVKKEITPVPSLAGLFPLFFNMLDDPAKAESVALVVEQQFLKPGGLSSTLVKNGQQWDAPNGWAPLQWIAIQGLRNYGQDDLAATIKNRWVELNLKVYKNTGKMVEKYNVEDISLEAGGGEYPVQDGFGWTNGVLLKLLSE